jgi:hypothetical protein
MSETEVPASPSRLAAVVRGYSCAATDATWRAAINRWFAGRCANGITYPESVFALREGLAWARPGEAPPDGVHRYMRGWHEASRWRGGGMAPEDVLRAIAANAGPDGPRPT